MDTLREQGAGLRARQRPAEIVALPYLAARTNLRRRRLPRRRVRPRQRARILGLAAHERGQAINRREIVSHLDGAREGEARWSLAAEVGVSNCHRRLDEIVVERGGLPGCPGQVPAM